MRAWPFLITASRFLDYRVVVAPDFVCQGGAELIDHFGTSVPTDYVPFDQVLRCEWEPPARAGRRTQTFELAYRLVEATTRHLGQDEEAPLKDKFRREIRLVEGLVIEGRGTGVTHGDLDDAHNRLLPSFQEFWRAESKWNTAASAPLSGAGEEPARASAPPKKTERDAPAPAPAPTSAPPRTHKSREMFALKEWRLSEEAGGEKVASISFAGDERRTVVRTDRQNIIICHTYSRHVLPKKTHLKGDLSPHLVAVNSRRPSQFVTVINPPAQKDAARGPGVMLFDLGDYVDDTPQIAGQYLPRRSSPVKHVAFGGDDESLVVVDESNRVTTWELTSPSILDWFRPEAGDPGWPYEQGETGALTDDIVSLAATSYGGGNLFITGDEEGALRMYQGRLAYKRALDKWRVHSSAARLLAASPDGSFLASSDGQEIYLYDIARGQELGRFSDRGRRPVALAIRLWDGAAEYQLFVGYDDAQIRIVDLSSLESVTVNPLPPSPLQAMDVTPDGRFIATVLSDGTLNVWSSPRRR